MAFKNKDLSVIAYANTMTFWSYVTQESIKDVVDADNYFERVKCLMNTGDVISIHAADGVVFRYIELDGDLVRLHKLK